MCLPIFPLVLIFALQIELIAVVDDSLLNDALSLENQHPNHAVAVSSISVETDETILFNPNTDEELTKYSILSFIEAWRKANNYLVVINTTDKFVYEPSPIGLDDMELSDDLTELQEAIAENAHEIWAKNRKDQGWSYGTVMKVICKENIITSLARCEHSRWNVEKLIMGFSPLKPEDWYKIESCFGKERRNLIKRLKKAGRHIDICSYRGLRRVNPEDMKYDFFLILAMPQILRSYYLAK